MANPYDRIKERRNALDLSQSELAARLGYSDRSTIAKIEKGVNDITQSKIESFAKALHTTPAYLMGWTNDYYDYELDEDSRFSEIPSATMSHLMELHKGDLESVWHAWQDLEDATCLDATTPPPPSNHDDITLSNVYLSFAKEAQKKNIDPDDIKLALDMIQKLKEKNE